ncbi:MAG: Cys-Xaa-Xaa-Xaa repeat radical SAM target protein [Bacteroidaceae bacterium]|nr:Cys-Xaa-Xaa-Xaa repeat radical SAM target protein [Bacteroidaceae bacterium]
MKVKKNKELRSRREFFKKAAKGALPILGAIVLASNPILSRAAEVSMGCVGCEGSCMSSCKGTCSEECKGTCKYDCIGGCKAGCRGTCKNSCKRSEY